MNGETPPKTGWLAYGRWPLAGILGLYLLLTIGYGLLNPLFEAPDEHWHYFTAQFIADNRALPTVTADYDEWLSQEAAQPPLYYLLGALMIAPIEASQGREAVWPNPFAVIGDASATTNANRFVHTPAEQWPWQDFALAAHMLRLFSTLLGLGTLLCIYSSGRLLWPGAPAIALLATALTAVLPPIYLPTQRHHQRRFDYLSGKRGAVAAYDVMADAPGRRIRRAAGGPGRHDWSGDSQQKCRAIAAGLRWRRPQLTPSEKQNAPSAIFHLQSHSGAHPGAACGRLAVVA